MSLKRVNNLLLIICIYRDSSPSFINRERYFSIEFIWPEARWSRIAELIEFLPQFDRRLIERLHTGHCEKGIRVFVVSLRIDNLLQFLYDILIFDFIFKQVNKSVIVQIEEKIKRNDYLYSYILKKEIF